MVTRVYGPKTLGNHMLPVRLHFFSDGLYVEAGDRKFASIIGGRVTRIGTMSVEDAVCRGTASGVGR